MRGSLKNKVYTITSAFVLSAFMASCGINNSSLPIISEDISINSLRLDAHELLQKSTDSYKQLKDFTGAVAIADSKTGNPEDTEIGESKFFFKKERKERVEITKSSDDKKVGSILVYQGGDKVQILLAKPIPILGKKFTLKVNDKKISTSRGLAFDQMDMTAMLNRLSKANVTLNFLGEGITNNRKTLLLEAVGSFKDLDNEVTREVVSLDAENFLPVQEEVFVKTKTVLKINVSELKLDVGLKDDTFVLPNLVR